MLAGWVEIAADGVERARAACAELRWHEAYRRRWREVRAEAGVRAAQASAGLEGARLPLELARGYATGTAAAPGPAAPTSAEPPAGPEAVLAGAVRGAAFAERLMPDLGGREGAALPPLPQLLARAHTLVGAGWLAPDALGRLRTTEPARDVTGLGPAPLGREVAARVDLLARTVATSGAPALVVAALVHAEILAVRPFVAGNGLVARLAFRVMVTAGGLDPTGSVLPEVAWAAAPQQYVAAAAGYATGRPEGVARWLTACSDAVVAGAAEARRVADGVLTATLPT
ncbi:filamentation induced by cAMP protein Fic [Cellulomonas gilvus ATCC 13127]|uniref:Filamentation induced by cAMP protein Fic n=1 Tax=Cellulomonas gilvus (strain ATCC 13127 / NRRL B-14078) TaxID=593907 RepID=F8A3T8_CELGA|nr:filamentation induced by cAMP protein Fic [Cellulomonas gilvus ATCC 13127]